MSASLDVQMGRMFLAVIVARGEVDMHIPLRLVLCTTLCMQAQ